MSCEMYEVGRLSPTLCVSHMSHGENVGQYDPYLTQSNFSSGKCKFP